MKQSLILLCIFCLSSFKKTFAQNTWINTDQNAIIKKIVITPNNSSIGIPGIINPNAGTIAITWHNGITNTASLQEVNHSMILGNITFADGSYEYFSNYYCDDNNSDIPGNMCEGIALKLVNNKLCVGGYRYNQLTTNLIFSLYDYGCFSNAKLLDLRPSKPELGILQKFTREELIDLLLGKKPLPDWPLGPVCLSCPPWPEFKKDLDLKLKNLKVRRFHVAVTEIKQ